MNPEQCESIARHMQTGNTPQEIQLRQMRRFFRADPAYGISVAQALGIDLTESRPNGAVQLEAVAENNNMKTQEQTILTTYSKRIYAVSEPGPTTSLEVLKEGTRAWHRLYCAENSWPKISARRWLQIEDELERTGTYWQSPEELEYGAKVAWRNSTRCIGRLHWQSLVVRDCRALRSAEEIFSALVEHVRLSTGTGKVVPMITVFAPEHSDQRPVRIWNRQLINYAGHRQSDGSIVGDPLNVPLTEVVRKLGWTRDPAGPFDLLPLLIETSEGLRWFDWPEGLILEVPIRHPDHPWFEELQLKWFALPAVSGMLLQIGGVKYPAAPFSGWYVGTEVGARDLADVQRYNVLPMVGKHPGLDTRSDQPVLGGARGRGRAVAHSASGQRRSSFNDGREDRRFVPRIPRPKAPPLRLKSVRDLEALPLIWRESGSGTRAVVESVLKDSGVNPRKLDQRFELGSNEAIKSLVIGGLGVGFFSC